MMNVKTPNSLSPRWPAVLGMPAFDPEQQRIDGGGPARFPRQVSVGPIELRIGDGDGPSAIAILE